MKNFFLSKDSLAQNVGFTMIELITVMIVLLIISGIVLSIMFSSLRVTNKTNVLTSVKQNGNYAISQMEKIIRNAKNFNGVKVNLADSYLSFCPSGSTQHHFLKITSFDGLETEFICDTQISSNSGSLVDLNSVDVSSCFFTCSQTSSSDFPTININLSLSQRSTSSFVEHKASASAILFQTSVTMRNLNR